ncbi:MAG: hypothetical protein KBF93_21300 [Leptospiraceae bacterium]|nr:hypothetical protein [Leptospiraceae bacterium]
MFQKLIFLLVYVIILKSSLFSFPQKDSYIFKKINSSEGLSHNIVSSMIKDKKGFLWIGTYGGLNRYDGKEFRQWTMRDGLVFDAIRSLEVDKNNHVWIGTEFGLSRLREEEFQNFLSKDNSNLVGNDIRTIKETNSGEIYIGTTNGLTYFKSEEFHMVKEMVGISVTTIYSDKENNIWIGTKQDGIYILNDHKVINHVYKKDEVISIEYDDNSDKVIASFRNSGLYEFNLSNFEHKILDHFSNIKLNSINQKNIIICKSPSIGRLFFFSQTRGSYFFDKTKYEKYNTENLNSCLIDEEGNVWLGTYGLGLIKYYLRKVTDYNSADGLTDPSVRSIFKDSKNRLWLGTQNNITLYENEKFSYFSKVKNRSINRVRAIIEDSRNRIWIGTGEQLLYYENNKMHNFEFKKTGKVNVYALVEYNYKIYVLMNDNVLISLNLKSLEEADNEIPKELISGIIYRISTDQSKANLYLQCSDLIIKYNEKAKYTLLLKKEEFDILKIQNFLAISEKHFILGDDRVVIQNENNREVLTTDQGIPSKQIVSLAIQNNNAIWIGTSKGVVRYFNKELTTFDKNEGLAGDFSHYNSIEVDNKALYVGSSEGLSIINFEQIYKNEIKPPVYFTKLTTNKKKVINEFKSVEFDHDENSIQLSAATLSFLNPDRTKYKFIFQKENLEQTQYQELNQYTYYNLKPGNYTFRVFGLNDDGVESKNWDEVKVTIKPAFWNTWWFRTILILSIFLFSYSFYSYRVFRIKQENIKLENLVKIRTKELRDEKDVSERLLLNILPKDIAERLKGGESKIADSFSEATILFADIVGFTKLSQTVTPSELVSKLNDLFSRFDRISMELKVEKIKTIGDCYMAVAGLPQIQPNHAELVIELGIRMLSEIEDFNQSQGSNLSMRIGINTGEVVAGVIGEHKFIYDLWGDAVNTASRMESSGLAGKIQVTEFTYKKLKHKFKFVSRGEIEVKGKGNMKVYILKN